MKLSKTQIEVIKLLKEGWTIGYSLGFYSRCWMQKGGLGYGGEAKNVRFPTFWVLNKRGLLKKISKGQFGKQEYILSKKGQSKKIII